MVYIIFKTVGELARTETVGYYMNIICTARLSLWDVSIYFCL